MHLNSTQSRSAWTEQQEDDLLRVAVKKYGDRAWATVANDVAGRSSKSCSDRWRNFLSPDIEHPRKSPFSEWEVAVVVQAQHRYGNNWKAISMLLPGRTNRAVKNLFVGNLKWGARLPEIQNRYLEAKTPLEDLLEVKPDYAGGPPKERPGLLLPPPHGARHGAAGGGGCGAGSPQSLLGASTSSGGSAWASDMTEHAHGGGTGGAPHGIAQFGGGGGARRPREATEGGSPSGGSGTPKGVHKRRRGLGASPNQPGASESGGAGGLLGGGLGGMPAFGMGGGAMLGGGIPMLGACDMAAPAGAGGGGAQLLDPHQALLLQQAAAAGRRGGGHDGGHHHSHGHGHHALQSMQQHHQHHQQQHLSYAPGGFGGHAACSSPGSDADHATPAAGRHAAALSALGALGGAGGGGLALPLPPLHGHRSNDSMMLAQIMEQILEDDDDVLSDPAMTKTLLGSPSSSPLLHPHHGGHQQRGGGGGQQQQQQHQSQQQQQDQHHHHHQQQQQQQQLSGLARSSTWPHAWPGGEELACAGAGATAAHPAGAAGADVARAAHGHAMFEAPGLTSPLMRTSSCGAALLGASGHLGARVPSLAAGSHGGWWAADDACDGLGGALHCGQPQQQPQQQQQQQQQQQAQQPQAMRLLCAQLQQENHLLMQRVHSLQERLAGTPTPDGRAHGLAAAAAAAGGAWCLEEDVKMEPGM
ncbi:MAG: hypothetical protein J3K34DRAFT_485028 [Monoraphidium minutum]|nr:MAG: hypothetical protein J3K34DRAFT_485028 [Monoraphidium minutum]